MGSEGNEKQCSDWTNEEEQLRLFTLLFFESLDTKFESGRRAIKLSSFVSLIRCFIVRYVLRGQKAAKGQISTDTFWGGKYQQKVRYFNPRMD